MATMQSMIRITTTAEDASTTERVLPTTAVWACVIWRTGFTSTLGSAELSSGNRGLNLLRLAFDANQGGIRLNASQRDESLKRQIDAAVVVRARIENEVRVRSQLLYCRHRKIERPPAFGLKTSAALDPSQASVVPS